MRKEILYLDTSVPSAYYDAEKPDRQELTKEFWKKLRHYRVVISRVTITELEDTKDLSKRKKMLNLVSEFEIIETTPAAEELAQIYVDNGIVPVDFKDDALHIALCTLGKVNYLVSWNFKHLVNVLTREKVKALNILKGYKPIEIIAPPEL
jgi:predicted nucleic acid-binding protein